MARFPMTLAEANGLDVAEFIAAFGDVAEHAPWVAEAASRARPFADREAMIAAFDEAMRQAPKERQLALIRAHPDLAGRAALADDITEDSRREQSGAGLDRLTAEEYARFHALNDAYKNRFGFPFIFAVRGATKEMILAGFEARVTNTPEAEFRTALGEIARIIRFRLEDRIAP